MRRARRHLQRKTPQSVVFPSPCLGHLPSPTFQNPRRVLFLVQEVQVQEVQGRCRWRCRLWYLLTRCSWCRYFITASWGVG